MFDPLSSTSSIFADGDDEAPPWPTTPYTPNASIPNLRRATTPVPPTPDKGPTPGIYGKEPQIYGQPESGLISPRETLGSNGDKFEKPEPYLRVRVTGLDRNRRDILVKLDAQTNLSNFTGTTYRNVSRSYLEFQQFYESLVNNNPQTIVPALPLAQTSAPTDEEDDRLVRIMLQRWITRVCEDPIIIHDEDLRAFIESDFGYQPTPRQRKKGSSGFSLMRRGVPDEDEDLQKARFELTKLEGQFFETAKAVDKIAVSRKALAAAHSEMGNKLINVATTEAHPNLAQALRKLGRTWHSLADLDQAQAISECVVVGDSLGYQGMNARSAKDTLLQRSGVLEEYQAAVKTTISKRRQIERLKASSNIRPERVDEALEEIEEANKYEQVLAKRAKGISENLHIALNTHNRYANDDLTSALIEHARSSIMYEKQLLRELEALRGDVAKAADKPNTVISTPKPTIVPPLEDYSRPPVRNTPPRQSTHTPAPMNQPQLPSQRPITSAASTSSFSQPQPQFQQPLPPSVNEPLHRADPLSAQSSQGFRVHSDLRSPTSSVPPSPRQPLPPQSPGAGPSSSAHSNMASPLIGDNEPLGGRFVDGTKSMFVRSPASPLGPTSSVLSSTTPGPLRAEPLSGSLSVGPLGQATRSPLGDPLSSPLSPASGQANTRNDALDPLGQARPSFMSSSVRVQPTRSRLDAREAASKLANMF